jgi:type II secretory pathway component PulK
VKASRESLRNRKASLRAAALVIVMVLVLSMAVVAGAFAYAMKVEARLAMNTRSGPELEWLGRSGVELAKWILQQQRGIPGEGMYDGLNQFWAGGPGLIESSDNPYMGLDMNRIPIGEGEISLRIVDLERRINVNTAPQPLLELAFQLLGSGSGEASLIAAAILDWRDRDDMESAGGGAEQAYYASLNPPYAPKNGPIDDLSELLRVRGISPGLYWGRRISGSGDVRPIRPRIGEIVTAVPPDDSGAGCVDIFTSISSSRVNVNTAPLVVLKLLLGGDEGMAQQIIERRSGPDGQEGTLDDTPFRNLAEMPGASINQGNLFGIQSTVFEVHVEARLGSASGRYVAILRRGANREGQVMLFHPE